MRAVEWRKEKVTMIEQCVLLHELIVAEYDRAYPGWWTLDE